MKVQNMIRMQAITVGFAATLFFASAAPAQEITNTDWPEQSAVAANAQSAPAQAANQTSAVANPAVSAASATTNEPAAKEAAVASPAATEGGWLTTLLVICLAGATLYSLAGLRRSDRSRYARAGHTVRSVPLA